MNPSQRPSPWRIALAFAALYVIWGSTYLAIKIAIETIPPLAMAAARFLLAGAILYLWARLRGVTAPTALQWRQAAFIGAGLIAGGNGIVTLAETWIDSSMAALVIASNPLFMALFSWWGGVQKRPRPMEWLSLLLGFAGVALLLVSSGPVSLDGEIVGYVLVLCAVISWTSVSVYSKRLNSDLDPWLQSGMQMLIGGLVCLVGAVSLGEIQSVNTSAMSARSLAAFAYLLVFGSIVGYSSYVYLLKHCSPSSVSSHAYVNPVVALFLGWLVLDEQLSPVASVGSGLVLVAVFALLRQRARP